MKNTLGGKKSKERTNVSCPTSKTGGQRSEVRETEAFLTDESVGQNDRDEQDERPLHPKMTQGDDQIEPESQK